MHFCISCEFLHNNNNRGDFISPDFSMQLRFVLNGATHSKKNRIQNRLPAVATLERERWEYFQCCSML